MKPANVVHQDHIAWTDSRGTQRYGHIEVIDRAAHGNALA